MEPILASGEEKERVIGALFNGLKQSANDSVLEITADHVEDLSQSISEKASSYNRANNLQYEWMKRNASTTSFQTKVIDESLTAMKADIASSIAYAEDAVDNAEKMKKFLNHLGTKSGALGVLFTAYEIEQAVEQGDVREITRLTTKAVAMTAFTAAAGSFFSAVGGTAAAFAGVGLTSVLFAAIIPVIAVGVAAYFMDQYLDSLTIGDGSLAQYFEGLDSPESIIEDAFGSTSSALDFQRDILTQELGFSYEALDEAIQELPEAKTLQSAALDFSSSDNVLYGTVDNDIIEGDDSVNYLWGLSGDDYVIGMEGSDFLFGGIGNDIVKGGDGNDHLEGDVGEDRLEGGAGNDTFAFNHGDGIDTIIDSQGANVLQVEHAIGAGRSSIGELKQIAPGSAVYREIGSDGEFIDNNTVYILKYTEDTDPGNDELLIVVDGGAGGLITIKNFNKDTNNFGLTFDDSTGPQQPPLSGTTQEVGDGYYTDGATTAFLSRTSDDRVAGTSYIYDAALYAGNDPSSEEHYPYIDPNDPSQGVHPFRFDGGDSNDALTGTEHTPAVPQLNGVDGDWLNGGDGNDIIRGDQEASLTGDDDHLIGGRGNDQLYGGAGNDYLVGWNDQLVPFTAGSYLPGPNSDTDYENAGDQDYLDGGEGNDVLVAGRGEDTLVGGAGADVIMANAGNDVITGGGGEDYIAADAYAITFTDGDNFYIAPDYHIDYTLSNTYSDVVDAGADDDIVHAGAGDDIVYGGAGSDSLYGDQVNNSIAHLLTIDGLPESSANLALRYADLAIEYHGNDYLDGGAGADYMFGNGGSDTVLGGEGDDIVFGDDYILTSDLHGNNQDVTTIDGVQRTDLLELVNGNGKMKVYSLQLTVHSNNLNAQLATAA